MSPEATISALVSVIGTLVGVIVYLWRLHLSADDKRDEERAGREALLIRERDDWKARWEAADARLGRVANSFLAAFKKQAPE